MGKNNEKNEIVRNSWALIQSRQSNTLFENKLTIAAIDQCFRNDDGSLSATFKIPDIKNMVGTTSYTSLKDAIKKISYNTMHYVLFIEEDDDDGFKLVNVFKHIAFNDKEKTLEVALNEDLRQYINPKENFTLMRKKTLMAFKSNFSYRLYEILMSRAYHLEEHDSYTFAVSLSDLRLQLGLVNVRQKYIANAIESNIPADIIVEEIARSKKDKIEEMKKTGQYDANCLHVQRSPRSLSLQQIQGT